MVTWEEIELQLAILQILLEAKMKQLQLSDEALSKTPAQHRHALRWYYASVGATDAVCSAATMAEVLRLKTETVESPLKALETKGFVVASDSDYKITAAGSQFIIDELDRHKKFS